MDKQRFETLVLKAIDNLPQEFKEKLENVDVIVEDVPSSRQLRRLKLSYPLQLLGLYEGVPLTKRGTNYTMVLPDKITIFQKSIEAMCRSDMQMQTEVEKVIRHEIAHHFGIDDYTLREIDKRK